MLLEKSQIYCYLNSMSHNNTVRKLIERLLFLTLVGPDNSITTVARHDAVPHEDVTWLHSFMQNNNIPFERAISILRRTHFPFHHDPYPWTPGTCTLNVFCTAE